MGSRVIVGLIQIGCVALMATCPAAGAQGTGDERLPPALRKAIEARARIEKASIEFQILEPWVSKSSRKFRARFAGDSRALTAYAEPETGARSPRHALSADGEVWACSEQYAEAFEYGIEGESGTPQLVPDMKSLGLTGYSIHAPAGTAAWDSMTSFEESRDGEQFVVRAKDGLRQHTWWIDPRRDWSVTRTTYEYDGEVRDETLSDLKRFGDFWYPESMISFRSDFAGGLVPAQVVEVVEMRANAADLPDRLTPESIGIKPGMNAVLFDQEYRGETMVYDGQGIAPFSVWADAKALAESGESDGETTAVGSASAGRSDLFGVFGNAARAAFESRWDRYTRQFIEHHKLDGARHKRAESTLERCKQTARQYMRTRARLFREMEGAIPDGAVEDPSRRTPKLDELLSPIDRIFDKKLKPGLRLLLTAEQRAAEAEKSGDGPR